MVLPSSQASPPFCTPSPQGAAAQLLPVQVWLSQSASVVQPRPLPPGSHPERAPPPQSWPVSLPFCTPSLQAGALQRPPVHTPLWQSPPPEQATPVPQGLQPESAPPPQSGPDSLPFFTPS